MIETERESVNVAILNANQALKQQQETIIALLEERDHAKMQVKVMLDRPVRRDIRTHKYARSPSQDLL